MYELDDIFHKLSRAGHDVSAAQRDFQMLQAFVSQLSNSTSSQSEKQRHTSHHHRTASVPSSSPSSHSPMALSSRPRSSEHHYSSTRQGQQHRSQAPNTGSSRSTSRHPPSSTSSYSSTSSSRNNSNTSTNANTTVWSPTPHRLIKPRRASVPPDPSPSASTKKVHFATHATVYTFNSERGRSASSPIAPGVIVPPSRPACVPRVDGRFSADGR
jgi:hypothetical protein